MFHTRSGGLHRPLSYLVALLAILLVTEACADATAPPGGTGSARRLAGGATTVDDATSHAFSHPAPNLSGDRLDLHLEGDAAFEARFVEAPAPVNSGLGPIFNGSSCEGCHINDGRTHDVVLLRLSLPGVGALGGPLAVPGFGAQLQDDAIFSATPEGRVQTVWVDTTAQLADGTTYPIRRPDRTVAAPYTPIPSDLLISVRSPRPVFGLGLLEAIPEATLRRLADEADADGDGVSGRVNVVYDVVEQRTRVGRFGWKANQPTLEQQVAAAYVGDMGVTSRVFPQEASVGQPQHDQTADDPELDDRTLDATTFYVQSLAVPAPRDIEDPLVVRGKGLFEEVGCASCHVPTLLTGELPGVPEVSDQTIYPYTDLLLHDMGPGLADGRPDWEASGSEWRTPPLWGVGLGRRVTGHLDLLHDGRARDFIEAILWHGGEAATARDGFAALPADARAALIAFLDSL